MSKTTVLLDFGSGPSEVVGPMTVYVRAASEFLSGNKVILPGPGPVVLDRAGRGSVQLDAEQVWEFVVSAPSYITNPSHRVVPTSAVPLQFADLVEVAAPPKDTEGIPFWVGEVLDARLRAGELAEQATAAASGAAASLEAAQLLVDGINANSAYQLWLDAGNEGTEADFLASLEGESAYDAWLAEGNTGTRADFLASLKSTGGTVVIRVTDRGMATTNSGEANVAAWNALMADLEAKGGGRVVVPTGVYPFSGRFDGANYVTVDADPGAWFKKTDNDPNTPSLAVWIQNRKGFRVRGLSVDFGTQATDSASIRYTGTTDSGWHGGQFLNGKRTIAIEAGSFGGSGRLLFKELEFNVATLQAVYAGDSSTFEVTIEGCHVTDVLKSPAGLLPVTAFYLKGRDHAIIGNTVENSYDTAAMVTGTTNVLVADNNFHTDMVTVYAGSGTSGAKIRSNNLSSLTDYGVHIHDRSDQLGIANAIVTGNTIHDTGKSAIAVEGTKWVLVAFNEISNPGLRDGSQVNPRTGATVAGVANPVRAGISTETVDARGVEYITIIANQINDTTGKMRYGIRLSGTAARGMMVHSNTIAGLPLDTSVTPNTGLISRISYVSVGTDSYVVDGIATNAAGGGSDLVLGTTPGTAKAGDWFPAIADVLLAQGGTAKLGTTVQNFLAANGTTAARAAIGAGTSSLGIGTTAATAKAGNWKPTTADVTDMTDTGKAVALASSASAARQAIAALGSDGTLLNAVVLPSVQAYTDLAVKDPKTLYLALKV